MGPGDRLVSRQAGARLADTDRRLCIRRLRAVGRPHGHVRRSPRHQRRAWRREAAAQARRARRKRPTHGTRVLKCQQSNVCKEHDARFFEAAPVVQAGQDGSGCRDGCNYDAPAVRDTAQAPRRRRRWRHQRAPQAWKETQLGGRAGRRQPRCARTAKLRRGSHAQAPEHVQRRRNATPALLRLFCC